MFNLFPSEGLLEAEQRLQRLKKLIRKAILKRRLPFFQKLMKEDKAWALYVMVIKKHIKRCKEKKLNTNYAKATQEQKKFLEHMDIEIATMESLIEIPAKVIKQAQIKEHQDEEEKIINRTKKHVNEESALEGLE